VPEHMHHKHEVRGTVHVGIFSTVNATRPPRRKPTPLKLRDSNGGAPRSKRRLRLILPPASDTDSQSSPGADRPLPPLVQEVAQFSFAFPIIKRIPGALPLHIAHGRLLLGFV